MRLVNTIKIDEVNYPIITNCIEIIDIIEMFEEEPIKALLQFYKGVLPHDAEAAIEEFKKFLGGNSWRPKSNKKATKMIDYSGDIDLIYTAILKEFKVNIFKEDVHWFELLWMMADLRKPSLLQDVLKSRSGNLPKEQAVAYSRLKMQYPLK